MDYEYVVCAPLPMHISYEAINWLYQFRVDCVTFRASGEWVTDAECVVAGKNERDSLFIHRAGVWGFEMADE